MLDDHPLTEEKTFAPQKSKITNVLPILQLTRLSYPILSLSNRSVSLRYRFTQTRLSRLIAASVALVKQPVRQFCESKRLRSRP